MAFTITRLEIAAGKTALCLPKIEKWLQKSEFSGTLKAALYCEIGELDRVLLIHDYEEHGWGGDRTKMLSTNDPFGIAEWLSAFHLEAYSSLEGTAILGPGDHGPVYEVREYQLSGDALAPTTAAWARALPDRMKISPLFLAAFSRIEMHRLVSIWPYSGPDERMSARRKAVSDGVWPPKGGIDYIVDMKAQLFLPADFSPAK